MEINLVSRRVQVFCLAAIFNGCERYKLYSSSYPPVEPLVVSWALSYLVAKSSQLSNRLDLYTLEIIYDAGTQKHKNKHKHVAQQSMQT